MRSKEIKQLPRHFVDWPEDKKKQLRLDYQRSGPGRKWTDMALQGQVDISWSPWYKKVAGFLVLSVLAIVVYVGGAIVVLGALYLALNRLVGG